MVAQLSGLQKNSIHLYRAILRAIAAKPAATQSDLRAFARLEFDRHRRVSLRNVQLIEHLQRSGSKRLQLMAGSDVTGVHTVTPQGQQQQL